MSTDKSVATVKPSGSRTPPKTPAPGRTGGAAAAPGKGGGSLQKAGKYLNEVRSELRKTSWPGKPELISQTQVVFGLLLLIGVFIAAWDQLLGLVFKGILAALGVHSSL